MRVDFDVAENLNEKSPINDSRFDEPFDQYESYFCHRGDGPPISKEHLYNPSRKRSLRYQSLPCLSPLHPSSMRGNDPLHSHDIDLLSQSKVVSSIVQMMDTEPHQTPMPLPCDDAGHIQSLVAQEKIVVVVPSVARVEVINCNDIKSCDLKRHLFGNFSNDDNDDSDAYVDQGVPLLRTYDFELAIVDLAINPHSAPSTLAIPPPSPIRVVDEFYNAARKAPHPNAIIPKKKLGW